LFIVDNADNEWNVARYRSEWRNIARAFDLTSTSHEIGLFCSTANQDIRQTSRCARWVTISCGKPSGVTISI
jgi:hypothetical protein